MTAIETKKMTVGELNVTINKEFVLKNVIKCVESLESWESGQKNYVTLQALDLPVYYRVIIDDEKSFKVTTDLMFSLDITLTELVEAAEKNTRAKTCITNLGEILSGISDPDSPTVITNERRMWGAGIISNKEIYAELCRKNGVDHCFILPSSIHELLVICANAEKPVLDAMVQEVNANAVIPEERLADHCYVYNATTNTIEY